MPSPSKKGQSPKKAHKQPKDHKFKLSPIKQFNEKLYTKDYFCHYSNAAYMGGMDCFKKLGHGIMLMDNGACALTFHSHDNMVDHNVIFRDGSLTSLVIGLNRTKTCCFRSGPFLLYFRMSAKDQIGELGFFVHYRHRKVFRLKFQGEKSFIKQRIVDLEILKKVFDLNDLSEFMQPAHCNTLKLQFPNLPPQLKISRNGDRFIIGTTDPQKAYNTFLGLCFKMIVKEIMLDFDVIIEERGYLRDNGLEKFGERRFGNGNYYIGEFLADRFHGMGVLIYPKEKKWTLGQYIKGQLKQVLQSSVSNESSSCQAAIKKIHELSTPYIQSTIKLSPPETFLHTLTKQIDEKDPYEHESIDYTKEQNLQMLNLSIVQDDYVNKKYEGRTEDALRMLEDRRRSLERKRSLERSGRKGEEGKKWVVSPEKKKGMSPNMANTKYIGVQQQGNNSLPISPEVFLGKKSRSNSRSKSRQNRQGPRSNPTALTRNEQENINRTIADEFGNQFRTQSQSFKPISVEQENTIVRALTSGGDPVRRHSPSPSPTHTPIHAFSPSRQSRQTRPVYPEYRNPTHYLNLPRNEYKADYNPRPTTSFNHSLSSPSTRPVPVNPYRADPLITPLVNPFETYQFVRYGSPEKFQLARNRQYKYFEEDDDIYDTRARISNRAYLRPGYQF